LSSRSGQSPPNATLSHHHRERTLDSLPGQSYRLQATHHTDPQRLRLPLLLGVSASLEWHDIRGSDHNTLLLPLFMLAAPASTRALHCSFPMGRSNHAAARCLTMNNIPAQRTHSSWLRRCSFGSCGRHGLERANRIVNLLVRPVQYVQCKCMRVMVRSPTTARTWCLRWCCVAPTTCAAMFSLRPVVLVLTSHASIVRSYLLRNH
jgi:hypothetical protein